MEVFMFKYSFLIVLIAFLLINFNGQENQIVGGKIKKERSEVFFGEYDSFTGRYSRSIKLKKGVTYAFTLSKNTKGGDLSLYVEDPKQTRFFEMTNNSLYLTPEKTRRYRINFVGSEHKGSFQLHWKSSNQKESERFV